MCGCARGGFDTKMPFFFKNDFSLCSAVKIQQSTEGALEVTKSEVCGRKKLETQIALGRRSIYYRKEQMAYHPRVRMIPMDEDEEGRGGETHTQDK